jgi:two-component system cell cycle response regulator
LTPEAPSGTPVGMERHRLTVLLVEANGGDLLRFRQLFAEVDQDPTCEYLIEAETVTSLRDGLSALARGTPDAAIVDLALPDAAGLDAVRALEPQLAELPVIVLTDDPALAAEAVRAGSQDYLVKSRTTADVLVRSIRYSIERHRMAVMLASAAFVDELTGLYNRRGFLRLAEHQIRLSRRKGRGYSLAFVDMTGVKLINDRYGRAEGDEAIRRAADVIRASFRESDVIARIGSDQFVALAIETDAEDQEPIKERLLHHLAQHNERAGKPYTLALSVGVLHQEHGSKLSLEDLLAKAGALMGEQKRLRREAPRP